MATTQNTYTGNGSTTQYAFTFPYLETTDIKVSLNGINTTAYTLANATTVQFNTAPANGVAIRIYRSTSNDILQAYFYTGSAIRSADLNSNFTQALYTTQETTNYSVQDIGNVVLTGSYTFSYPVSGVTPTTGSHLATKQYCDSLLFNTTGITDGNKGDITVSGTGTIWAITAGSIVNTDVNTAAAIAYSKLSLGNSIVNSDVSSSAAIAYSKLNLAGSITSSDINTAGLYTNTVTAISKTLANRERCTVTAAGLTITLPASPSTGWEVTVSVLGGITNTIIGRNATNIMSLAENMTIDRENTSVTFYYVDAIRGWRII